MAIPTTPHGAATTTPTRWLNDIEMAAWLGFVQTQGDLLTALEHDLQPTGLTLGDYQVFVYLSASDDNSMKMCDLAELLQQRIRRRDTLARVGGNTFTILMEHCSLAQIERVAEAVHRATRDYGFGHRDEAVNFTVTISVVAIDARSRSVDRVLKAADRACYAAKSAGGDRVLVHGHSDRQAARERRGAFIE